VKLSFSPLATDDLMEIASFIAHDNPARALTFVDQLQQKCHLLGVSPGLGTSRPELGAGAGVKMLPFGRYLIFYREANKGLRIERIMHSARDLRDQDFEGAEPH